MTTTLIGSGAPRLQHNWDSRAACNFIGGGSGTGLLLAAAVGFASGSPYFLAGTLALALIAFGLSMVWLEIGRPLRALNVFFHPQTSWMSREALLALPVLALGTLAVLLDQPFVSLPFQGHLPVAVLASAAAILWGSYIARLGFFTPQRVYRHGVSQLCSQLLSSPDSRKDSVFC